MDFIVSIPTWISDSLVGPARSEVGGNREGIIPSYKDKWSIELWPKDGFLGVLVPMGDWRQAEPWTSAGRIADWDCQTLAVLRMTKPWFKLGSSRVLVSLGV